jgi:hypothetical protein
VRPAHLSHTPSWDELMKIPEWKQHLRTPGYLPPALRQNGMKPWCLWILFSHEDRANAFTWARLDTPTYAEAFNAWVRLRQNRKNAVDWSITCKPKLFEIPAKLMNAVQSFDRCVWCPRCRRPVELVWTKRHHALQGVQELCTEPALRCPYCGIRGGNRGPSA